MTEPQQPERQSWSVDDLPVLTEVSEPSATPADGVEIPNFDFSDELDALSRQQGEASLGLEFPPELLEEAPAPGNEEVALDFDQLPSLDLSGAENQAATTQEAGDADFAFELEPAADVPAVGLDALMARASLEPAHEEVDAATLADEIRELDRAMDSAAEMPIPMLNVGARPVPEPDLAEMQIPELTEDVVPAAELTAEAEELQIPELTTEVDELQVPELTVEAEEPQIPELTAEAEEPQIPELTAEAEELQIPELTAEAEEPQIPELTAEAEEPQIPELTDEAEEPQIPELTTEAEEPQIPELTAEAEEPQIPELTAEAEEPQIPELTAETQEPSIEPQIPELTAEAEEPQIPELTTEAEESQIPELTAEAQEPSIEPQIPELTAEAEESQIPELTAEAEELSIPELTVDVEELQTPELTEDAQQQSVAEQMSESAALQMAEPMPESEQVSEAPSAAVDDLPVSGAQALSEPAVAPFRSISLDSLPTGVLNGGMAIEAATPPMMASPSQMVSSSVDLQEKIREAERLLELELQKQALLRAQEEAAATSMDSLLSGAAQAEPEPESAPEPQVLAGEPLPEADELTTPASEMPDTGDDVLPVDESMPTDVMSVEQETLDASPAPVEPEPNVAAEPALPDEAVTVVAATAAVQAPVEHKPVEIINVAGLASSPSAAAMPPLRKSYVTLVDEAMLIDSLYHKILPRMKVELSMWLQDALDHQAKQMLSGVMHQLKEDYEMLFSETLRESLRQAIAEMGREDRGERF